MTRDTYISDDWNDNALTGRTNPSTGAFLHPSGDTEAGDCLVGIDRPEWPTASGSPSANSNGEVEFPSSSGSDHIINTKSEHDTGSWKFDFAMNSASARALRPSILAQTKSTGQLGASTLDNSYFLDIANQGSGNYNFWKDNAGTTTKLISATWSSDTAWHTSELARDPFANWEIFEDGASKGTATDTLYTSGAYVGLGSDLDAKSFVDNLQVS